MRSPRSFPKPTHVRVVSFLAAAACLAGCPGPEPVTEDAGAQPDAPMPTERDGGMRRDAGPSDDDFSGARPVPTDGTAVMDAIEAPNDRDFWRFEGNAGDWVAISTEANPDDDPEMVDTVITLYDASRMQIAENDDALPRTSTDSEIVIRLPATGTYYIEVQEFSTWMPSDPPMPRGRSAFRYELTVVTLADGGPVNIDAERGNDAASAQALRFGGSSMNLAFVLGSFASATDVDVYSFSVSSERRLLSIDVMPAGPEGYGSTRAAGRAMVTNRAGDVILARIEPRGMSQDDLSPTLTAGDYLLWVDAGGGTAGANDHYVLKAILSEDNPLEAETMPGMNDSPMTAERLALMEQGGVQRGFILARLDATDVDVFSFEVAAGRRISAFCGAQSSGSGVRGLTTRLLGPDGMMVLGMGSETATRGAAITDVSATSMGTYYLRLAASGRDPMVAGDFVRCGVRVAPPM